MPKLIDRYQKPAEIDICPSTQSSKKNLQLIPTVIGLVIFCFLLNVGADTLKHVSTMDHSLAQQSKVCLAEFSKKTCDSLKLSDDCRRLLQCVQMDDSTLSRILLYLEVVSNEILQDYPFPSVFTTILLIFYLIQTLETTRLYKDT